MEDKNEIFNYIAIDRASAISGYYSHLIDLTDFRLIADSLDDLESYVSENKLAIYDYLHFQRLMIDRYSPQYTKVHIGRSRQDILITCQRMNLRNAIISLHQELLHVRKAMLQFAQRHLADVLPSFTNGVQAQITTGGHIFVGYEANFKRTTERLFQAFDRINSCPLGSAAIGGTSIPLNRTTLAALLGFDRPCENTFDGSQISAIDIDLEIMGAIEAIAVTIGVIVQDIHIQYQNPKPWFYLDSKRLTQPSTLMPQKRNPVALNHVRMQASRTLGACGTVRFLHHNAQSGLTDHKRADSWKAVTACAELAASFSEIIENLNYSPGAALAMLNSEYSAASEIANTLFIECGIPFRHGHQFTSSLVDYCRKTGTLFHDVSIDVLNKLYKDALTDENLSRSFPWTIEKFRETVTPEQLVKAYAVFGGGNPSETLRQINKATSVLEQDHKAVLCIQDNEKAWALTLSNEVRSRQLD